MAQAVPHAKAKGYRSHPQRARFKQHPAPLLPAIAAYLLPALEDFLQRGYAFNAVKIVCPQAVVSIAATDAQPMHELVVAAGFFLTGSAALQPLIPILSSTLFPEQLSPGRNCRCQSRKDRHWAGRVFLNLSRRCSVSLLLESFQVFLSVPDNKELSTFNQL